MMPRLEGNRIEQEFEYYRGLVRKGVAGFIVFGGELNSLRERIKRLQKESVTPLIIASDLEQGLGQQVKGGTLFPPAMAIGEAAKKDPNILKAVFKCMADEARYAGINMILAPVLDVNTNPDNPIISTRAFGEDPETVSAIGSEMIKTLRGRGIEVCGKHFPGHGDTGVDSHITLPVVGKSLNALEECELVPFRTAVKAGLKAIMLGHLSVPAIEPSGMPVSLSANAVRFLREKMRFKGIVMTDAMNMGGISAYSADEAASMALRAGVDVLLHPDEPEKLSSALEKTDCRFRQNRLVRFRKTLISSPTGRKPRSSEKLSMEITKKAIKVAGSVKPLKKPFIVLLNDDEEEKGKVFIAEMAKRNPSVKHLIINSGMGFRLKSLPQGVDIIVAVFSAVKGWKGGTPPWLKRIILKLKNKASVFISFGSPHILDRVPSAKIYAYWDSEYAQRAVSEVLSEVAERGTM